MIDFAPKQLDQIKTDLQSRFPLPSDFALADKEIVLDLLERVRKENSSFLELPATEWNYIYQISDLCTDEEYAALENIFLFRMTRVLFDIGWVYCQWHPDNHRAVSLFLIACNWMKQQNQAVFDSTLMGRISLSWKEIYAHCTEIIRANKLTMEEFCREYNVEFQTPFYVNLQLNYLSECSREALQENESLLASLIPIADIEKLRPVIRNYVVKIPYEEMPQLINDTISYRLSNEDSEETLGLSPLMLQRIRSLRFGSILESCVNSNSEKLQLYLSMAGMIRKIELLTASYYVIDFGNHMVLDSGNWKDHAFAYLPKIYKNLNEEWIKQNYADSFWPGIKESEIATAHDVVLGLKKSSVIRIEFTGFDKLYTKDVLSITRYKSTQKGQVD